MKAHQPKWVVIYNPTDGGARRVIDTTSARYAHKLGRERVQNGVAVSYSVARYTAHVVRGTVPL